MVEEVAPRFKRRKRWVLYGALFFVPAALGIAWAQRVPIARHYIDEALTKRGIRASYDIRSIGTKHQRLENLIFGSPDSPDLTADWAEIDVSLRLFGANVRAIRASGVRLRARFTNNTLSLGSLDALMPPESDEPLSLPDIYVALHDARIGLVSDNGTLGARIDGRGRLVGGFNGSLALVAPKLAQAGCTAQGVNSFIKLSTRNREILVTGPLRAKSLACGASSGKNLLAQMDLTLPEQLNRAAGYVDASVETLGMPGASLVRASLKSDFSIAQDLTTAKYNLSASNAVFEGGQAGQLGAGGQLQLRNFEDLEANGAVGLDDVMPSKANINRLSGFASVANGTPAQELAVRLANAIRRLENGSRVGARYGVSAKGGDGLVRINGLTATSQSGAKLAISGVDAIRYSWAPGAFAINGDAVLSGGNFPTVTARLSGQNGSVSGTARVDPLVSGNSRISLSPVQFAFGSGAPRFETVATFDGQLGTTRINGLVLPISLGGGAAFLSGCKDFNFNQLEIAGANLGRTRVNACFAGDDVRISAPRLSGTFASARFDLAAQAARYNLKSRSAFLDRPRVSGFLGSAPFALDLAKFDFAGGSGQFGGQNIAIRLGAGPSTSRLALASVNGRTTGQGAAGLFSRAEGKIGAVPLNFADGNGNWKFANSILDVNGRVGITDAEPEMRFQPMTSPDFKLRFADNRVTAEGGLIEPVTNANVARVTMRHALSNGAGQADIDVPSLTFGKPLQPEQLTRITLGVIANVEGQVSGRGTVRWRDGKVESDGRFSTSGMDFAAAFGPVRQLRGDIAFTDLLGMVTAPDQKVTIAEINSGVQVTEGLIRYRLLPGLKAQVEGGRWPFSGGELYLEPTTLDLTSQSERKLTFRVVALDAAKFINQLQLENIAATGTFDGVLPMVFDQTGGRIEAGNLIVREGGGTLSYIGEVSRENLGTYGSIAFDALKSMRYRRLSIDLGGPLDGEMITQIRFNGVNQAPIVPGRQKLPLPIRVEGLTGIPFIFNITIRAPFRGLVSMARSFQDPSGIIQQELERERLRKQQQENKTPAEQPIQQ